MRKVHCVLDADHLNEISKLEEDVCRELDEHGGALPIETKAILEETQQQLAWLLEAAEEAGWRAPGDTRPRCADCRTVGETTGHQTCQYPGRSGQ